MAKFTIIYRRTIQTEKYHTSTIGLSEEFDTADISYSDAYRKLVNTVEQWIYEEKVRLAPKGG